jgi:hypothetical protein
VQPIRLTPREEFAVSELPVIILTVGGRRAGSRSGSEDNGIPARLAALILASRTAGSRVLHNRWVLGWLLSFAFIWIVSAFCDSSEPIRMMLPRKAG